MTKFTKTFLLVLAILATFALVGCSNGGEDEVVDYDHTIIFYSSQGDALQQKTDIAIQAFQAKYPGWKVIHTGVGGYDDVKSKVVSDLQGGIQPDLAYCYSDHVAQYLQTSKVVDMNKYINKTTETIKVSSDNWATSTELTVNVGYTAEEIADFVPGYYAEGLATNFGDYDKYGYAANAMLTLPFVKSTELLYYNKTALDTCGFEVATTWDEIWEQAATLKATFPTATPLGYDSEANWFITMCEQNGWGYTSADANNHYLFNNAKAQAWLEQLAGYYDLGYIVTQKEYGSYTSNLFTKGENDGGIIYCIGSSGGASYQSSDKFTWGVAPLPGSVIGETVNKSVISQGPSITMLYCDRCTNQDEKAIMTFLFVKELMDPTFQATFSIASGYNPARISSYEVPEYIEHLEGEKITAIAANVATTMTEDFFTSPAFVGSSTARDQVGNALVYAITGEKSAQKALQDAYANCGGK